MVTGGRAVTTWLLYSRRRFYGVLIAAVVLVTLGVRISSIEPSAAPVVPPPPPPVVAAPPPPPPPPAPAPAPSEPSSPRAVAEEFARLWASPDTPQREWLQRLRPLATEEYGAVVLAQVDPVNVPAGAVTGEGQVTSEENGLAQVTVPLDGLSIRVELVDSGGAWLVADVEPLTGA